MGRPSGSAAGQPAAPTGALAPPAAAVLGGAQQPRPLPLLQQGLRAAPRQQWAPPPPLPAATPPPLCPVAPSLTFTVGGCDGPRFGAGQLLCALQRLANTARSC